MHIDWNVIHTVSVLFFIIIIGYVANKKGYIDLRVSKGLSDLLLNITLPCSILISFNMPFSRELLFNASVTFGLGIFLFVAFFFISKILYSSYPPQQAKVLRLSMIFSNSGFMGFPVIDGIFGNIGMFYASIYSITFNLSIFSLGIFLLTGEGHTRTILKNSLNPSMLAILIGFIVFMFSWDFPPPVAQSLKMLAGMTSPLSMLIIGATLAQSKISEVFMIPTVYYSSLIRLIACPLLTLAVCKILSIDTTVMQVMVVLLAMPTAAMIAILSEKHGGDSSLASKCVLISTILSILSIPGIVSLVK